MLHKTQRTYINFNYTSTLEKIYGINSKKTFHLHGKVGEEICFGHGNNDEYYHTYGTWGAEDSLGYVRRYFLKDTSSVLCQYANLFETLKDVNEIYSYGFSFSDVDMVYVDEICKQVNPKEVVWYFNEYDSKNNISYLKKIEEKGFIVKTEKRW